MKTAMIGVRIKEEEKAKLEAIAAKRDIPLSQLVREAIKNYINQEA